MQRSMWADACETLCEADGRIVNVEPTSIGYMHTGECEAQETRITTSDTYMSKGMAFAVVCRCGIAVAQGDLHTCVYTAKPVSVARHGDPRFYELLNEIAELHSKKSFDYTPAGNPLANFHRSERFGVPAWKGALVRIGDKLGRLEQLASGKEPANESMRDTLIDTAVYSLLCVLLLEDAKG